MNEYLPLPSLENLKQQAKRLRAQLEGDGPAISHSKTLELLAHQYGYKDWNTLHAAIGNQPPGPQVVLGGRVSGHYLGQPFTGEVISVSALSHSERFRVTINFDKAVDVVKFEGMSNMRKRVTSEIGLDGLSIEKTTQDGAMMQLDL